MPVASFCAAGTSGEPEILQDIVGGSVTPFANFTQALNAPYVSTPAYGDCVPGCVSWYTVQSGDYCAKIASDQGIFLNAFLVPRPWPLASCSRVPRSSVC